MTSAATRKAPQADIALRLASPGADFDAIANGVLRRPEQVGQLMDCLAALKPEVRYGAAKILKLVSRRAPQLLYPRFDDFFRLFDGDNTILRWASARILGNLAAADVECRFDRVLDRYLTPIRGREMIGAANVIGGAARIAAALPHLAGRIAEAILEVEGAVYKTPECRNVAIGHAIRSFSEIFPLLRDRRPVFEFVARQLENARPATRKKAVEFRKRWAA
jgi:hypothetical protein